MTPDWLEVWLAPLRASPLLPLYILGVFVLAGALFVPVWLLILQTGLLLSPPLSFFVALGGALLSATTFFFIGRLAKERIARRFGKTRGLHVIHGAGVEHIIALRVLPVLPWTLVNLCAGALGVPYRTFVAGTVIGMSPGIFAVTFLGDRARDAFVHPTVSSVLMLVGAAAILLVAAAGMKRLAKNRVMHRYEAHDAVKEAP